MLFSQVLFLSGKTEVVLLYDNCERKDIPEREEYKFRNTNISLLLLVFVVVENVNHSVDDCPRGEGY